MDDKAQDGLPRGQASGFAGAAKAAPGLVRLGASKWQGDKRVGPNDPCPCGSKRKLKKCCGRLVLPPTPPPVEVVPAPEAPTEKSQNS